MINVLWMMMMTEQVQVWIDLVCRFKASNLVCVHIIVIWWIVMYLPHIMFLVHFILSTSFCSQTVRLARQKTKIYIQAKRGNTVHAEGKPKRRTRWLFCVKCLSSCHSVYLYIQTNGTVKREMWGTTLHNYIPADLVWIIHRLINF